LSFEWKELVYRQLFKTDLNCGIIGQVFDMGRETVENLDSKVVDMSLHLMKVGVLSSV
jgi:hypothetical protein